jgi:hypothetical protein
MTDQQASADERDDHDDDDVVEAFVRKSTVGVYQFLFEFWPAWMVNGKRKKIAPLCRIVVGDDDDGSVLLDKNVMITGLLHLVADLTRAVSVNIGNAEGMPEYTMEVPGGMPHVLELLGHIEDVLKDIRHKTESRPIFVGFEGEGDDRE